MSVFVGYFGWIVCRMGRLLMRIKFVSGATHKRIDVHDILVYMKCYNHISRKFGIYTTASAAALPCAAGNA